jgi:hypothetical protein
MLAFEDASEPMSNAAYLGNVRDPMWGSRKLIPLAVVEERATGRIEPQGKPGNGVGPGELQRALGHHAASGKFGFPAHSAKPFPVDDDDLIVSPLPGVFTPIAIIEVEVDSNFKLFDALELEGAASCVLFGFGHGPIVARTERTP